jgi:hypothetical protein
MPSFLVPVYTPWAEDKGPLVSTPEMTIINWCHVFAWDMGEYVPKYIQTDVGACRITHDHSFVGTADVVWFNWKEMEKFAKPPQKRPRGALWVYYLLESPAYSRNRNDNLLHLLRNQINMMVTYQSRSEIADRYSGYLTPHDSPLIQTEMPSFAEKKEFMVAMISNSLSKLRETRIEVRILGVLLIMLLQSAVFLNIIAAPFVYLPLSVHFSLLPPLD